MFALILVFLLSSVHSQAQDTKIVVDHRVYVALKGENVSINIIVTQPANQSGDTLTCYSPSRQKINTFRLDGQTVTNRNVKLTSLQSSASGEYSCEYKKSRNYWCLLVRDEGYRKPKPGQTSVVPLVSAGIIGAVLLIFSVAGSVYVFTGHGNLTTDGGGTDERTEGSKEEEVGDDRVDVTADASATSCYASLEPRPQSIYEVLNPTEASSNTSKENPRSQSKKLEESIKEVHDENGVFESVYENF